MGPVTENLELLVKKITDSKMNREQVIMFMGDVIGTIVSNNVPLDQRWGVSMTLSAKFQKLNEKAVDKPADLDYDVGC